MDKILWDFRIQMEHLIIPNRKSGLIYKKKRTYHLVDFLIPVDESDGKRKRKDKQIVRQRSEKEKQKAKNPQKTLNIMAIMIEIEPGALGMGTKDLEKRQEELERRNRYHSGDSIVEISRDTEKSPGDLRRITLTETPVKDHLQTPVGKTRKE